MVRARHATRRVKHPSSFKQWRIPSSAAIISSEPDTDGCRAASKNRASHDGDSRSRRHPPTVTTSVPPSGAAPGGEASGTIEASLEI